MEVTVGQVGLLTRWNKEFLHDYHPSIQYLELYAVAAAVMAWIRKFQNKRVVIFVDNTSVRDMINSNVSGCRKCMVLVRLIVLECLIWNVRLFAKYVESQKNDIADALSHDDWVTFYRLTKNKNMDLTPTMIADEIYPVEKFG